MAIYTLPRGQAVERRWARGERGRGGGGGGGGGGKWGLGERILLCCMPCLCLAQRYFRSAKTPLNLCLLHICWITMAQVLIKFARTLSVFSTQKTKGTLSLILSLNCINNKLNNLVQTNSLRSPSPSWGLSEFGPLFTRRAFSLWQHWCSPAKPTRLPRRHENTLY